ncbi:MAG: ABC1 kinase family protein [bacterium]
MSIIEYVHRFRNILRLRQIANVLLKHGFGYILARLNLSPLITSSKNLLLLRKTPKKTLRYSIHERARMVMEELGPTFVKFGQIISSRPDLIPIELAEELKKLQDEVPPIPFEDIKEVIEEEFTTPWEDLFAEIDPVPLAAASIAQVHGATLLDGQKVILKIQRPGISKNIENDIHLLFYLARLTEKYLPESRIYQPVGIVEEFSRTIRRELDFLLEAVNADRFRDNFTGDDTVYIPRVYWELSSRHLLTLERVNGIRVDEVPLRKEWDIDRKRLAVNGCNAFLRQVFEFGLFHGDPHPGNLIIRRDGVIVFVDFGIVGQMTDELKAHIANVFVAIINRDYEKLVHELLLMGFASSETKVDHFKRDLSDFFDPYYGQPLKNIPVGFVFNEAMRIMARHQIKPPTELILLGKTLLFVEGIGRQLDLDFNLLEHAKPFAEDLVRERVSPQHIISSLNKNIGEIVDLIKLFPRQSQLLFKQIINGELEVKVRHHEINELNREIRQGNYRNFLGTILAALIIGTAIIAESNPTQQVLGFSALSVTLLSLMFASALVIIVLLFSR